MAAADAGVPGAISKIQSLQVIYCQSWQYDNAPLRLAERLGASPGRVCYSGIGGNVPQELVSATAGEIMAGRLELALVVGGEALATIRALKKAGARPSWSFPPEERRRFPFDVPFNQSELDHGIFQAWLTFALFENARRARLAMPLSDYRGYLGQLLSTMTEVAAKDKGAWFAIQRSAEEILGPSPANRMVAYPYSKLMTAMMDVDMAAAVLIASDAAADSLGVPADKRVYLRGWCSARDPNYIAERQDLSRSSAMELAGKEATRAAAVTVEDVDHLDLYSCFSSSVGFALDALGLDFPLRRQDDEGQEPLQVTVTGGLPYHGGPGSNYMTHAMAAMATRLRELPGTVGMISGVGMHMTKHVYAVYSTTPGDVRPPDEPAVAAQLDAMGKAEIARSYSGRATVATYSVVHSPDGEPAYGILVCDLPDGRRCYGRLEDQDALRLAEAEELVGRAVSIYGGNGEPNLVRL